MLGLALFLGQMASALELVVLRLFGWETYLMKLNLEVNQNLSSVSRTMVSDTIMEFRLLLLITFQVINLIWFCLGKIVDWTEEELEKTSKAVGYGAVKYVPISLL
jgi:hypothetical protein